MVDFSSMNASWIWMDTDEGEVNQYVEFRHEFSLDGIPGDGAEFFISSDTDYVVWINGKFVDFGQYDDYPDNKTCDILKVSSVLKPGRNFLCVLAYYQGETSFQYIKGKPGIIYALDAGSAAVGSSEDAYCRKSLSYASGPVEKITMQLSFTFCYDATGYDNWISEDYTMGKDWKQACIKTGTGSAYQRLLRKRPVKKLFLKERAGAKVITQGIFLRKPGSDTETFAQLIQTDFLSHRLPDGVYDGCFSKALPSVSGINLKTKCFNPGEGAYMVIDLGREEAGLLEIELSGENGTTIDIAYGEHLDDLRVRAAVGGRNFACRYVCREGRQTFTHYFKRFAGRYMELHISGFKKKFILHYCGLRSSEYPVEIKGSFDVPDHLHGKIYDVSVRTLHLCMHEHYEDCPWREQALYTLDSRNQALCGYYCFGEYDFPLASYGLLGDGLKEDGYLELCAPTDFERTIPACSMGWIMQLWDLLLYSGRIDKVQAFMPKIKKMLDMYIGNLQGDLLASPKGKRYWHFYEWTEGVDGIPLSLDDSGNELARFDAPLNLYLCMALDSGAKIAAVCGDSEAAQKYGLYLEHIRKAFHERFWDESSQAYRTYAGMKCREYYNEITQALAILTKACPEDIAGKLRERLAHDDNGLIETTLCYMIYKFEAILQEPEKYAETVFRKIAEDWGYMLYNRATSFWETIKGADDFDKAGSLCHGWTAIPVYFYHAHVLGVKPLEPGFKTFEVNPVCPFFYKASGSVPTPYGPIVVEWEKTDAGIKCNVTNPEEIVHV